MTPIMMRIAVVFPAPFRSYESEDFPWIDVETEVVEGFEASKGLVEVIDCKHGSPDGCAQ